MNAKKKFKKKDKTFWEKAYLVLYGHTGIDTIMLFSWKWSSSLKPACRCMRDNTVRQLSVYLLYSVKEYFLSKFLSPKYFCYWNLRTECTWDTTFRSINPKNIVGFIHCIYAIITKQREKAANDDRYDNQWGDKHHLRRHSNTQSKY